MPLPSSNPGKKISVIPGNLPINLAAISAKVPNVAEMTDAFDVGIKNARALGDDVIIRPAQNAAAVATLDNAADQARAEMTIRPSGTESRIASNENLTDEQKAAMVIRPLLEKVKATQAEANFTKAKNEGTEASITEAAINHPDYQSALVTSKIAVAEHAARQAVLDLDTLTKTGADITNEEVLKAKKKVRDAQYDLDTLKDEQKVLDIKRGTTKKAAEIQDTQAGVALQVAKNPNVQAAQVDTATADIATGRLASLTNLARQVATGAISPTAISPDDDAKLRLAAQNKGVNVIDASGRPRPLAEVTKEFAGKIAIEEAAPVMKELREVASASQGSLSAIQTIKGLGNVNTGYLYTLPGVKQFDSVLAQFGVDGSQKREVFSAMNSRLVPLVRQPGSVSNFEQALYQRALPGPGVSEKTNTAMIAGLYSVAERNTKRPAFYDALLSSGVPAGEVEQIWSKYIDSNPSILDGNTVNKAALSPDQYLAALKDPASAARTAAPTDPAIIATLPKGDTDAELAVAPATSPYIAVKNARGVEVPAANPSYWRTIVEASQVLNKPATLSPQSGAYMEAFRKAQATPLDTLLRVAPSAVPASPFTGPIRPRK